MCGCIFYDNGFCWFLSYFAQKWVCSWNWHSFQLEFICKCFLCILFFSSLLALLLLSLCKRSCVPYYDLCVKWSDTIFMHIKNWIKTRRVYDAAIHSSKRLVMLPLGFMHTDYRCESIGRSFWWCKKCFYLDSHFTSLTSLSP